MLTCIAEISFMPFGIILVSLQNIESSCLSIFIKSSVCSKKVKVVIAALQKMYHCVSVVCLLIRVLSIVRIFLGYPYFTAIDSQQNCSWLFVTA